MKRTPPIYIVFLLLLFLSHQLNAQSRKSLEKKRKSLNRQIQNASKLLNQTAASRRASLQELSTLQSQMKAREQLIEVIQAEISQIDVQLLRKQEALRALEEDLTALKANYKKILIQLYRYRNSNQSIFYLLSIENFNKSFQRQIYLRQIEKRRSEQALLIRETQEKYNQDITQLEVEKKQKTSLLDEKLTQKNNLKSNLNDKDQLVKKLKKKEASLRSELRQKENSKKQLNRRIENVIRNQIASAKSKSRTYPGKTKTKKGNYIKSTTPSAGKGFGSQKGRLSKPVSGAVIISRFGRHQHPVFDQVITNNNGVDYRTKAQAVVKAVYEGTVVSVFAIPGSGNAVMLQHGNYYTTYSNLSTVFVKRGAKVKSRAQLGRVQKDSNSGSYILHFELWNGKKKENPEHWLRS